MKNTIKRPRVNTQLNTINDIKVIETPTNVTDKYVPIHTTDIIKALEPEFNFVKGVHFGKTKHYVILENEDKDRLVIYNSFNGSLALRIFLHPKGTNTTDSVHISLLDEGRVIHKGDKAKYVVEELENIKKSIKESLPKKKELILKLQNAKLTPELQAKISEAVSKEVLLNYKMRNIKAEFVNYTDVLVEKTKEKGGYLTVLTYLNLSIKNLIDGNYGIKIDDKTKGGRKTTSVFNRLKITNHVNDVLKEEFPEYFV
jgi:hypothetical protein